VRKYWLAGKAALIDAVEFILITKQYNNSELIFIQELSIFFLLTEIMVIGNSGKRVFSKN
jgi:hypothetical protein